ncbi:hypothetical protein MAR_027591 [Mya arenaria]|uniref:G-protein coupled receptors family 1 profile domain-containing protein n=1 Tax=Mya arenaria TaxID=6604 RepID=A0ABY7EX63_MYAAR|nr:hypothetical protein MAR_027591 [Mya arenaria]
MDIRVVIISLILALTIVGLLFVACRELLTIKRSNRPEGRFKLLIASSILASLVSDLIIQTNLLLSQASGGWPLGFASCEFWGYLSTVAMACSSWLITIIVIERYFTHMLPSESESTFSGRNTRITVTGVCLLVMMTVSGPFYGFGEYTFLRGYLNVIVSTNISLPLHLSHPDHSRVRLENLHQLFSHLQRSSYSSSDTNLLTIIAQHLHNTYDVIVSKASWLPHGISFFIRSKNSDTFQHFVDHYRDRLLLKNVTSISFIHDIARFGDMCCRYEFSKPIL